MEKEPRSFEKKKDKDQASNELLELKLLHLAYSPTTNVWLHQIYIKESLDRDTKICW